jgi:hypothetical protein
MEDQAFGADEEAMGDKESMNDMGDEEFGDLELPDMDDSPEDLGGAGRGLR